jgi:arabinofuranosyltransferase
MGRNVVLTRTMRLVLLGLAVGGLTYIGYRLFFFITDDAFIAFRYINNQRLGYGLVWNPPPFQPVEGYTSWLWITLLGWAWSITGIAPPSMSNLLSLCFGYATLYLGYRFVERMELSPRLAVFRISFMALIALGTLTNRTFLAWLSSGLETSLFNFCFTLWIYQAFAPDRFRGNGWVFRLAAAAALTALTRPDGLLVAIGTLAILCVELVRQPGTLGMGIRKLSYAFPLLAIPAHLAWRRVTYGEWLPNTYYAKYTSIWVESGWRYALSFTLEYALWIWLLVAAVWLVRNRRLAINRVLASGVIALHLGYYTFIIGGDHFEYRVYSHLILLVFISLLWLAARLDLKPAAAAGLLSLLIVASWPLPWMHYMQSRQLTTRDETRRLILPLADRFPPGTRFYAETFDRLQDWLINHSVCIRHQEHKVFYEYEVAGLFGRDVGSKIEWAGRPVLIAYGAGLLGWNLPHVALLDALGLNDYVVARTPAPESLNREMAHSRRPPPGYTDCFLPNISIRFRTAGMAEDAQLVHATSRLLTDEQIAWCESYFRQQLNEVPPPRQ